MRKTVSSALILATVAGLGCLAVWAEPPGRGTDVPLFVGLGKHTRPEASKNVEAQRYVDQALNFLFAFNHDEAIRAFRRAAALDPSCALAHWGIALANGRNYNYPAMPPDRAKAAWDALRAARADAAAAPAADRALIEALGHRYANPMPDDPKPLEAAYAKAMKDVWARFPSDADIGALYAESLMNLRPWELWTADGKPEAETLEILRTLEAVLKQNPDHPLALHLYIHAVEALPDPGRADEAARRLRGATPALGHLLHMPSHIDIRRGRWGEAIEANRAAIAADNAYQKVAPEQGFYRLYMAHNHHMLAFAAMMRGESKVALATLREAIAGVPPAWLAVKENAAIVDGFAAAPVEVMKRFGRWDDVLSEPEPPASFRIARTLRQHARAVAFAAKGQIAEARAAREEFRTAAAAVDAEATFGNNKASDLFAVAAAMLDGEILLRSGHRTEGLERLRTAVAREDKLRYSEPPDWIVPVRHALGAFLLRGSQLIEAEAVYREDLRRWPANGWSLHGLAACLEARGQTEEARRVRSQFDAVWKYADVTIPSSCFCVSD